MAKKELWERMDREVPADHFEHETWAVNTRMHEVGQRMPEGPARREHFRGSRAIVAGVQSRRMQAYIGMYGEHLGTAAMSHLEDLGTSRDIAGDHVFRYSGGDGRAIGESYLNAHRVLNRQIREHDPRSCGHCAETAAEFRDDPEFQQDEADRMRRGEKY